MKVVGLLSGGKDSCFNLCHCVKNGHDVVALATLAPPDSTDELDSYMYQTVGHDAVHLVAAAMELPLYRHRISGTAVNQRADYGSRLPQPTFDADTRSDDAARDETEDLFALLMQVKRHHPDVEAVSVGAILSNYQRVRVEHVALRTSLALLPLTFLWQRSQPHLYDEMIRANMTSILIKVAGIGLEERDLGKTLHQMRNKLWRLHDLYGAHVCGEGGEYETLTLDSPLFKKRIEIKETQTVVHSDSGFGSVSYLRIKRAELVDKQQPPAADFLADLTIPDDLDRLSKRTLEAIQRRDADAVARSNEAAALQRLSLGGSNRAPPWLPAVRTPALTKCGRWIGISGIDGQSVDPGRDLSLEEEVVGAFEKVQRLLSSHSPPLDLSHLAHINLYLSSQSLFPAINAIYKRHFGSSPPTRACIATATAATSPRFHLSAVAFDDVSTSAPSRPLTERKALHVQGRSYWAPANIGPYSQAVTIGERIWIAGQIGLRPKDLTLPSAEDGTSEASVAGLQSALAMQHARRIFDSVLESRLGKGWVEGGVCWLDERVDEEVARRCWQAQLPPLDGASDDDASNDSDDEDDAGADGGRCWLSPSPSSAGGPVGPPIIFATLPNGSLPRSALVEWQLTAHTGRSVGRDVSGIAGPRSPSNDNDQDDDDDSDDGEDADLPTVRRGSFVLAEGQVRCDFAHLSSERGGASFGIAAFRSAAADNVAHDEAALGWFRAHVDQRAFAKTLLISDATEVGADITAIDLVQRAIGVSAETDSVLNITTIPVAKLYALASSSIPNASLKPVSFALLWHGV